MSDEPDARVTMSRPHMPGYGILPADEGDGLLPWSWAEERLQGSHSYWVATTRPDGRPHLTPVWAVWLDGRLWFSSGRESRKAKNLTGTPQIVMGTDNPDEPVIIEGTVESVPIDDPWFRRFNDAYLAKYDTDVAAMGEPVYRVRPAKALGLDERNFVGSATRWVFTAR